MPAAWYPFATKTSRAARSSWARRAMRGRRTPLAGGSGSLVTALLSGSRPRRSRQPCAARSHRPDRRRRAHPAARRLRVRRRPAAARPRRPPERHQPPDRPGRRRVSRCRRGRRRGCRPRTWQILPRAPSRARWQGPSLLRAVRSNDSRRWADAYSVECPTRGRSRRESPARWHRCPIRRHKTLATENDVSLHPLVEPATDLSVEEVRRYSRHLIIPDVGMAGQKRLKNARVLVIGAGGLGSPALMYLAAAGVGTLGIIDFDVVDESNLQRQIIHGQSDIGTPKALSAKASVEEINPYVNVVVHTERLDNDNVMEIFASYDLIVDGTDNFATRYLVNDAAVLLGKPYVWGSIYRFDGQASVFWAEHGPCYRCLYPEPPPPGMVPSCAEGGVLGVLCATLGSVQANEAVKLLCGIGDPLVGRLLIYDALELSFKDIAVRKDPECAVCGKHPTVTELIDYEEFCGVVSDAAQQAAAGATLTPAQLKALLDQGQQIKLVDVREPAEWQINRLPGATLIPLDTLPDHLAELPQTEPVVLYCKSGVRSAEALALLKQSGFSTARHLGGGITAWAKTVDPSVPVY